jgi:hypothetical protein
MEHSRERNTERNITVTGIALVMILVLAFIRPGPVAPPYYDDELARTGAHTSPAVDMSGSQRVFSADDGAVPGTAIFWEMPEPDTVRITIELRDEDSDQDPQAGDDSLGAADG